eukprot:jgi/Ulvmu1/2333/UM013_0181.1
MQPHKVQERSVRRGGAAASIVDPGLLDQAERSRTLRQIYLTSMPRQPDLPSRHEHQAQASSQAHTCLHKTNTCRPPASSIQGIFYHCDSTPARSSELVLSPSKPLQRLSPHCIAGALQAKADRVRAVIVMESVLLSGLSVDPVSIAVKCAKLSAALYQANTARGAKLDEFARYMNETAAAIRGMQGHLPATSDHTLRCLERKLTEASIKLEKYQSRNAVTGTMRAKSEAAKLDQLILEVQGLVNELSAAAAAHSSGVSAPQQAQHAQQPMYPQPVFAPPVTALPSQSQLPQLPLFSQQAQHAQQPQSALSALQAMSRVQQTRSQQTLAQLQAHRAQLQAHRAQQQQHAQQMLAQLQAQSAQQQQHAQQMLLQLQAHSSQLQQASQQASQQAMQQVLEQMSGAGLASNPFAGGAPSSLAALDGLPGSDPTGVFSTRMQSYGSNT